MKKLIKTLEENSKHISLTSEEKSALRERVISYMKATPIGNIQPIVSPYVVPSRFTFRTLVPVRKFHFAPIILIVVLLLGSGLSAAAEETVPGDNLYFIKTNINENVQGWLALSDEAKVDLDAQIASTRLEEAEQLASENKLSPEVKTELVSKFKAHADNFKAGVKTLESQGKLNTAAGASSKFESSLNAHENVLLSLGEDQQNGADLAASVAANVKDEAAVVTAARVDLEEKVKTDDSATTTEASAADAQTVAEQNITDLTTSLQSAAENASSEDLANAYTRLALATSTLADADTKMSAKDFADAFILYQKAHRISGEVQITLDAEKKLKINVTSDFGDDPTASSTATSTATTTLETELGNVLGTSTEATSTTDLKITP